jgi:hypothetical protein
MLYELDLNLSTPANNLVIDQVSSPGTNPSSIGGTFDRLYHCDINSDLIYELDLNLSTPANNLVIDQVASPGPSPSGIGGMKVDSEYIYDSTSSDSTINRSTSSDSSSTEDFDGEIYIDIANGNDSYSGTSALWPIKTLARLNDKLLLHGVGNVVVDVYFAPGKYTASFPIVIPSGAGDTHFIGGFIGKVAQTDIGVTTANTTANIYGSKLDVWLESSFVGSEFIDVQAISSTDFYMSNILMSNTALTPNSGSNGLYGTINLNNVAIAGFNDAIRMWSGVNVLTDVILSNGSRGVWHYQSTDTTITDLNIAYMTGNGYYDIDVDTGDSFTVTDSSVNECNSGWHVGSVNNTSPVTISNLISNNCTYGLIINAPDNMDYTLSNCTVANCDSGVLVSGSGGSSNIILDNIDFQNNTATNIQLIQFSAGKCVVNATCTYSGSPTLDASGSNGSEVIFAGELDLEAVDTDAWNITMSTGAQCNVSNDSTTGIFTPLYNTVDGNNSRIY